MFALDPRLAVEDLDAAVDRVREDRGQARLVAADAGSRHDAVIGDALGGHLEGLHHLRCRLEIGNPADASERRAVISSTDHDRLSAVADWRPTAGREALACQLLLGAEDVGCGGGGVELVDRHEDVGVYIGEASQLKRRGY